MVDAEVLGDRVCVNERLSLELVDSLKLPDRDTVMDLLTDDVTSAVNDKESDTLRDWDTVRDCDVD